MKPFNKVCRVGTIFDVDMFIKISNDRWFSISGVIGPDFDGNCHGGCGQINMGFAHRNPQDNDNRYTNHTKAEDINLADGWTVELWLDLLDVWKTHHLTNNLPSEVMDWLKKLPDTDKQPIWV